MPSDIVTIGQQQAHNQWKSNSASPVQGAGSVMGQENGNAASGERVGPAYILSLSKEAQEHMLRQREESNGHS